VVCKLNCKRVYLDDRPIMMLQDDAVTAVAVLGWDGGSTGPQFCSSPRCIVNFYFLKTPTDDTDKKVMLTV